MDQGDLEVRWAKGTWRESWARRGEVAKKEDLEGILGQERGSGQGLGGNLGQRGTQLDVHDR